MLRLSSQSGRNLRCASHLRCPQAQMLSRKQLGPLYARILSQLLRRLTRCLKMATSKPNLPTFSLVPMLLAQIILFSFRQVLLSYWPVSSVVLASPRMFLASRSVSATTMACRHSALGCTTVATSRMVGAARLFGSLSRSQSRYLLIALLLDVLPTSDSCCSSYASLQEKQTVHVFPEICFIRSHVKFFDVQAS